MVNRYIYIAVAVAAVVASWWHWWLLFGAALFAALDFLSGFIAHTKTIDMLNQKMSSLENDVRKVSMKSLSK